MPAGPSCALNRVGREPDYISKLIAQLSNLIVGQETQSARLFRAFRGDLNPRCSAASALDSALDLIRRDEEATLHYGFQVPAMIQLLVG
jgi:hypothetical protein